MAFDGFVEIGRLTIVWTVTVGILAITFVTLLMVMTYKLFGEKEQARRFAQKSEGGK